MSSVADSTASPSPANPALGLPAHGIPVERYDLTLLWPVRLEDLNAARAAQCPRKRLQEWTTEIERSSGGAWREHRECYPAVDGPEAERQYAEFVYFHPFVRNFLYVSRDDVIAHAGEMKLTDLARATDSQRQELRHAPNRNLRILERADLLDARLEVTVPLSNPDAQSDTQSDVEVTVCLDVRNVELYVFDTSVALLVLKLERDVSSERPGERLLRRQFTLQTVLQLQDQMRRAYAPYWEYKKAKTTDPPTVWHRAGHCPRSMRLVRADRGDVKSYFGSYPEKHISPDAAGDRDGIERDSVRAQCKAASEERQPPVVALWERLLEPLQPARVRLPGSPVPTGCALRFHQIEDERLATFSYLAVPNPRQIAAGDWLRLATVDDPDDSERFPYSPAFLGQDGTEKFAYDRFWSETDEVPSQSWFTTRWLCCGYGFTAVGDSWTDKQDDRLDGFFTNRFSGARAHFRHHYFKLGLIAHFHRASLLAFKHDLAEAVETLRRWDDEVQAHKDFQERVTRIEKDLLTFRNMYWFTEVSNQIQAQELFDRWSEHLRTQKLFDQVFAEAREASEVIVGFNQRREEKRLAQLTLVAAAWLVFQPLLEALGAGSCPAWVALAVAFALLLLVLAFSEPVERAVDRLVSRWRWRLLGTVVGFAILGWTWSHVLSALGLSTNAPNPPGATLPAVQSRIEQPISVPRAEPQKDAKR